VKRVPPPQLVVAKENQSLTGRGRRRETEAEEEKHKRRETQSLSGKVSM
jgi:hypothetical protein